VNVSLNVDNDFESAAVQCPICPVNKFVSLAVQRKDSPRRVFIGNFKKHVEKVHTETLTLSNERHQTTDGSSTSSYSASIEENVSDESLYSEFIEEDQSDLNLSKNLIH
jgi:hypothetical protein